LTDTLAAPTTGRKRWVSLAWRFIVARADQNVLVQIRMLVNGGGIRKGRVALVTYWHVELPAHPNVLLKAW
jgi:hypothetical protein